jgi:hypothetical protein
VASTAGAQVGLEYVYIIYGTVGGATRVLRVGQTIGMQSRGDAYRNLPTHPSVEAIGMELSMEVFAVRRPARYSSIVALEIEIRGIVGQGPWDHAGNQAGHGGGSAIPEGNAAQRLRWRLDAELRWHLPGEAAQPQRPPREPAVPRPPRVSAAQRDRDLWGRALAAVTQALQSREASEIARARELLQQHAAEFRRSGNAQTRGELLQSLDRIRP